MINLLSPDTKKNIRAARRNVQLRKYVVLVSLIVVAMLAVHGAGFYIVMSDKALAEKQLNEDREATASYSKVLTEAKAYKSNLKVASKVLSTGMVYSDFLVRTAKALPSGAVLTDLSLSSLTQTTTTAPAAKQNGLVLRARTSSYGSALQVKESLESSDLFENVSLSDIIMTQTSQETPALEKKYPVTLTINVTITKQNGV